MKTKIIIATMIVLFLTSILTSAFSPVAKAHTAEDPFVTDLIAGQTMDVGDVLVWNDGVNLYVKYVTTSPYVMSETHLAVATSLSGIPHTNQGSPIPGQFPYSTIHDPAVSEFTYTIPLGSWTAGTKLFVAAHARVCGPGQPPTPAEGVLTTVPLLIWSEGYNVGTVTVSIIGSNLVVTFTITFTGWLILDTHLFLGASPPPTWPPDWASFPNKHEALGGVTSDSFTIPLSSLPVGVGELLWISAEANVQWDATQLFRMAWGEVTLTDDWQKSFSVTIPPQVVCNTAWGKGKRFVRTNWAMYFTYLVQ